MIADFDTCSHIALYHMKLPSPISYFYRIVTAHQKPVDLSVISSRITLIPSLPSLSLLSEIEVHFAFASVCENTTTFLQIGKKSFKNVEVFETQIQSHLNHKMGKKRIADQFLDGSTGVYVYMRVWRQ